MLNTWRLKRVFFGCTFEDTGNFCSSASAVIYLWYCEGRRGRGSPPEAEGRRRGAPPEAGGREDSDEDDRIGRKIARRVCSGKKAIEGKEIATRITSGGGWRVSWMWVFTALASNLASQVYFPNLLELLLDVGELYILISVT